MNTNRMRSALDSETCDERIQGRGLRKESFGLETMSGVIGFARLDGHENGHNGMIGLWRIGATELRRNFLCVPARLMLARAHGKQVRRGISPRLNASVFVMVALRAGHYSARGFDRHKPLRSTVFDFAMRIELPELALLAYGGCGSGQR